MHQVWAIDKSAGGGRRFVLILLGGWGDVKKILCGNIFCLGGEQLLVGESVGGATYFAHYLLPSLTADVRVVEFILFEVAHLFA